MQNSRVRGRDGDKREDVDAVIPGYIARMKKEKEERLASESANSTTGWHPESGSRKSYSRGAHVPPGRYQTSYHQPTSGYKRGGYAYGARGSYHPYPRVQAPFRNRTAIFNKSDPAAESSSADATETSSPEAVKRHNPNDVGPYQTERQSLCPALTSTGTLKQNQHPGFLLQLCTSDHFLGVCARHGCRYLHDPNKQALCKRWLYKDDCPKGAFCSLSHDASPQNAPTCLHFQDGRCNNDDCRFAHVRVNPAAPNCEAFGRLGYCDKGDTCTELHAHECPSFSNTGMCSYGDKCRLGHVHRASRMRTSTRPSSLENSPSDSHDEDMDTAEDVQEWITASTVASTQKPHQFTQQADFVSLDADN